MKITNITSQVKNPDRVSVFVDGSYSFSLSTWQLSELKLKVGQELSPEFASELQQSSDFGKLYDRTLKWAYMRLRSEREVRDYLRKLTDSEDVKQSIMARLEKLGLIDDAEFARAWVASRRRSKHSSDVKLRSELRQKGVEESIIANQLSEAEVDESAALMRLVEKKRKLSRYKDNEKLMRYLAGQGYRYDQIKDALARAEEHDQANE